MKNKRSLLKYLVIQSLSLICFYSVLESQPSFKPNWSFEKHRVEPNPSFQLSDYANIK